MFPLRLAAQQLSCSALDGRRHFLPPACAPAASAAAASRHLLLVHTLQRVGATASPVAAKKCKLHLIAPSDGRGARRVDALVCKNAATPGLFAGVFAMVHVGRRQHAVDRWFVPVRASATIGGKLRGVRCKTNSFSLQGGRRRVHTACVGCQALLWRTCRSQSHVFVLVHSWFYSPRDCRL